MFTTSRRFKSKFFSLTIGKVGWQLVIDAKLKPGLKISELITIRLCLVGMMKKWMNGKQGMKNGRIKKIKFSLVCFVGRMEK